MCLPSVFIGISSSLSVDVNTVAGYGRVPLNSLQGIWNKFSKQTEPLFYHLVLAVVPNLFKATVGGGLTWSCRKREYICCDQDFPKGLNVCAHTVAVAELCGKLSEFVAQTKTVPSLSHFAECTCLKERGEKDHSVQGRGKHQCLPQLYLKTLAYLIVSVH